MIDQYKSILVAVDGSEQSEQAFLEAATIAKRNDATLHVLYVIEEVGNYFGEFTVSMTDAMEKVREREERHMTERVKRAKEMGVSEVVTHVMYGYPKVLIAGFSETETPIDLIVIGKTGLNSIQRVFIGSTAAYVVNHAKANVLVVNVPQEK